MPLLIIPEDPAMVALVLANAAICTVTAMVSAICSLTDVCSPAWWGVSDSLTLLCGWLVSHTTAPHAPTHQTLAARLLFRAATPHHMPPPPHPKPWAARLLFRAARFSARRCWLASLA